MVYKPTHHERRQIDVQYSALQRQEKRKIERPSTETANKSPQQKKSANDPGRYNNYVSQNKSRNKSSSPVRPHRNKLRQLREVRSVPKK